MLTQSKCIYGAFPLFMLANHGLSSFKLLTWHKAVWSEWERSACLENDKRWISCRKLLLKLREQLHSLTICTTRLRTLLSTQISRRLHTSRTCSALTAINSHRLTHTPSINWLPVKKIDNLVENKRSRGEFPVVYGGYMYRLAKMMALCTMKIHSSSICPENT